MQRAPIYVRVSTDKQTVENQARELRQIAQRRGWQVVEEYRDAGLSGSKGRKDRPGLDDGPHALVFPCRQIPGGWMNAESKKWIEVRPTH